MSQASFNTDVVPQDSSSLPPSLPPRTFIATGVSNALLCAMYDVNFTRLQISEVHNQWNHCKLLMHHQSDVRTYKVSYVR